MNMHKADLFISAVKYFAVNSWAREWPADFAYDRLLDKAKSHEIVMVYYHQDKESRQDIMVFPATVSLP